jgi:hypothetical protein
MQCGRSLFFDSALEPHGAFRMQLKERIFRLLERDERRKYVVTQDKQ